MNIIIRTKGFDLTEAIENYLKNKSEIFINKYFHSTSNLSIKCRIKVIKNIHVAEINIFFNKYLLRGESKTKDMYSSIDEVFCCIEKQYKKHKDRLNKKNIRKNSIKNLSRNNINEDSDIIGEDLSLEIIRRKKLILKPMTEEEAIMQMDLIGHSFYIYLDSKTNNMHVVYKRKEDCYGVIETKK